MPRVTIAVPGAIPQPYRFSVERQKIRLGRSSDNDIVIDSPSISNHHAEIDRTASGYVLRDLDSTNGLKINDVRVKTLDLAELGRIRLGDVELNFELAAEEAAAIDAETPKLPKLPSVAAEEPLADPAAGPPAAEEAPARKKRRRSVPAANLKLSPASLAILAVIAIVALFVGANLRHYQLRGKTLIGELLSPAKPATEAPAAEAPPQ
jgi:predicted component of type VI protein secretion system